MKLGELFLYAIGLLLLLGALYGVWDINPIMQLIRWAVGIIGFLTLVITFVHYHVIG